MLKRLFENFSEEKKNEVGLEITLFSIMYLIFIYPENGFKFNIYLLLVMILYLAFIAAILLSKKHPANNKKIKILGKEVFTSELTAIIIANISYISVTLRDRGFNFRSVTFMDFGFLIVLNLIFVGIYKIMRMG